MNIKKELGTYGKAVTMPGGYSHNLPDTLRLINLYKNSKFKTGDKTSKGKKKFFYNIVKPACDNAAKNIDIDTKDIILLPKGSGFEWKLWILERELHQWMEKNGFDSLINELTDQFPEIGHIVLKKDRFGVHNVLIENIRTNPSTAWLKDSGFVFELHRMGRSDILDMDEWDQEAVNRLLGNKQKEYDVYECYKKQDDGRYRMTILSFFIRPEPSQNRSIEASINQSTQDLPTIELFTEVVDELPYMEKKWENVKGRWLGMGIIEYLFEEQVHENEVGFLEMDGLRFKSLHLMKTDDTSLGGNVLTDKDNGDVLITKGTLEAIDFGQNDNAAIGGEQNRWDTLVTKKTFVYDPAMMKSKGNTKQLAAYLQQQQTSYFKKKKENLGIFLEKVIMKHIIPSFGRHTAKERYFTFSGSLDEMEKFDKAYTDIVVTKTSWDYFKNTGFWPSEDERMQESLKLTNQLKKMKNRTFLIPSEFYKNAKYSITIVITGENADLDKLGTTLQSAMQILAQNPAILQNDGLRAIFFKFLELQGVQPVDLNLMNEAAQQIGQQQLPQGAPIAQPNQQQASPQAQSNQQV